MGKAAGFAEVIKLICSGLLQRPFWEGFVFFSILNHRRLVEIDRKQVEMEVSSDVYLFRRISSCGMAVSFQDV